MDRATEFKFGDRLIHDARPEWGVGVVTAAQQVTQEGAACQRLTLRFERAGLKTLSTAHATLRLATEASAGDPSDSGGVEAPLNGEGGWLGELEAGDLNQHMSRLPESTRDPFSTLGQRLKATLALYRFTDQGAPLLDWAAMQTGLKDPLTRFSRHELEQFFRRFSMERENHLKQLVLEVKKNPPSDLRAIVAEAPEAAGPVLRKHHLAR